jgi:nucleoside-diphosphate-sugar epimerase
VGEIFNIGNPRNKITINALAKKIKVMTKSKSRIRHISYETAYEKGFEDMKHREPDITKIKKFVGFHPKIELHEMLNKIIEYFK